MPCRRDASPVAAALSCPARIVTIALGILTLLAGAFTLAQFSLLQHIGTIGGSFLTSAGSLLILGGLFIQCTDMSEEVREVPVIRLSRVIEPRALEQSLQWVQIPNQKSGGYTEISVKYVPLKTFLESKGRQELAILARLKSELGSTDLEGALRANFARTDLIVALPYRKKGIEFDAAYLLGILKLIYFPNKWFLELSLKELETYDDDYKNIVSLRLQHLLPPLGTEYASGSMGNFLSGQTQLSLDALDPSYYFLLSPGRVRHFLQNPQNMTQNKITALFPISETSIFFVERREQALSMLPKEYLQEMIPLLSGRWIVHLMRTQGANLTFQHLTEQQVHDLFLMDPESTDKSIANMKKVPIACLNQILRKMSPLQLQHIPDEQLAHEDFKAQILDKSKVISMFPMDDYHSMQSKVRISKMHSHNQDYVKAFIIPDV